MKHFWSIRWQIAQLPLLIAVQWSQQNMAGGESGDVENLVWTVFLKLPLINKEPVGVAARGKPQAIIQ